MELKYGSIYSASWVLKYLGTQAINIGYLHDGILSHILLRHLSKP